MSEELRSLQATKPRIVESSVQSSRSSLDYSPSPGRVASPMGKQGVPSIASDGPTSIDFVYLKNVLLQFLEQRDKKYQTQLLPVLGMLLHFDKWVLLKKK